ncbi:MULTISPECIES: SPOR domain-containing protein [Microbacterium]|uniref:SPOR domain-containing protein n=1 Tax=Microbacterium wangchenii TaxID=2541726 RepID=A0ABX5SVJ3_9MICO|nr:MULTISPECIES: SPOR domain-containing protein [Microbacterium]MCK6065415.1 SPOR domain-containing protein [Microbacterium sp. EYE_512]QBR88850.1 SPOR domain-containing protein [Microbacterium wangchenii]TFV82098.1 SPOR domain-containing protein [Microbacterium sp. dk485]TXK20575.1 SPOR domain-containing protein [Microbacterium wangchenii]
MSTEDEKYWYNLSTGEVERGYASPAIDRAGPFDTAEEAARAPELLKERSRAWAEDEAREDNWGAKGSRD